MEQARLCHVRHVHSPVRGRRRRLRAWTLEGRKLVVVETVRLRIPEQYGGRVPASPSAYDHEWRMRASMRHTVQAALARVLPIARGVASRIRRLLAARASRAQPLCAPAKLHRASHHRAAAAGALF